MLEVIAIATMMLSDKAYYDRLDFKYEWINFIVIAWLINVG